MDFTKFYRTTNVKDDSSIEVTHDTIDVDKFRMNRRNYKYFLENSMSILGISKDKHNAAALGNINFLLFVWITLVQGNAMKLTSRKKS